MIKTSAIDKMKNLKSVLDRKPSKGISGTRAGKGRRPSGEARSGNNSSMNLQNQNRGGGGSRKASDGGD